MKKLQKIKIRNFQCIDEAEIELGNITIIRGKSRSGKSSFFRAMRGLVENETGDEFTTFGEKETVVYMDGIAWIQSKTRNEYQIWDEETGEVLEEFEKCGRDVPEAIQSRLGMGKIEFSDGLKVNLNFYSQLDQIFLVQGKGSDNAKIVGSITNLLNIYNGVRSAKRDTDKLTSEVKSEGKTLEEKTEQLNDLKCEYDVLERKYKIVKEVFERAQEIEKKAEKLAKIRTEIVKLDKEIEEKDKKLQNFEGIDLEEMIKKIGQISSLRAAVKDLKATDEQIRLSEKRLAVLNSVSVEKLYNTLTNMAKLLKRKSELQTMIDMETGLQKKIELADKILVKAQAEMEEFDTCDVCGSEKEHWQI